MQVTARFLVALVLLVLGGCRPTTGLRPRLILQGENVGDEFWLAAPYVFAVKILHAERRGSPESIFPDGPRTLQLVKFDAHVENVVKGSLPSKEITFYFFAKLDQNPRYYLDPGKRYIVSLRSEGGILRSWADGSQLKIEVHSGSHDQRDLPLALGPRVTIAYILMTPGQDCNLHEFASRLDWPSIVSGNPEYVNQRLVQLELNPNREVADSACLTAATIFWHRPSCLGRALQNPDEKIRAAAKRLEEDDVKLPQLLRTKPFPRFPTPWTDYMSEMYGIYSEDARPEVRQTACAALRSFAPARAPEACR